MNGLPSSKQLRYLVALSEHLNFTRAAEACFVTQSTLSAGLKELEDLLGAKLVERDRQRVLITPLGEDIARRARDILAAEQELVEAARAARDPLSGIFNLGVIPTVAPFLLPAFLQRLRERHPTARIALYEGLTANLLVRLEAGKLHAALIALPYATEGLEVQPLFDDPLWLVGSKDDPAIDCKRPELTPALEERLLLLEEGHCLREHALHACNTPELRSARSLEATSLLTLVQMIDSGLGVGLVPEMAVHAGLTQSARLVSRQLPEPAPKRVIALASRRSTPHRTDIEILGDVLREAAASRMDLTPHA